jgi:hypothetical protein
MNQADEHYHAVQFYKDEQSLASTVARFLAEGIKKGEPGIIVATPAHTTAVNRELQSLGLNIIGSQATGELRFLDAAKMLSSFMVAGMPDPLLFKSNVGDAIERLCHGRAPCPIRVYGEMVDLLWQDGNQDGAIRLEILWNQLASAYEFSLLCGYAVGHFYKETRDTRFQQVVAQHSEVIQTAP